MYTEDSRPWAPPRPVPPPGGYLQAPDGTCHVPGVAVVTAAPHRSRHDAAALARRIATSPRDYLPVLVGLDVLGVADLRPVSHCRGGSNWAEHRKAVSRGA